MSLGGLLAEVYYVIVGVVKTLELILSSLLMTIQSRCQHLFAQSTIAADQSWHMLPNIYSNRCHLNIIQFQKGASY